MVHIFVKLNLNIFGVGVETKYMYTMWQLVVVLIFIFHAHSEFIIHNIVNVFLNIVYSLQNEAKCVKYKKGNVFNVITERF